MIFYPADKEAFLMKLPHMGPLLCLDVGSKRIGLAVSDITRLVATPLGLIQRTTFSKVVQDLLGVLRDYNPVGLVVGYPLEMSGTEGRACQGVRHFSHNLVRELAKTGVVYPLLLWDERLSTVGAEGAMLEADLSRANRATRRDKIAASLILRGFLEFAISAKGR